MSVDSDGQESSEPPPERRDESEENPSTELEAPREEVQERGLSANESTENGANSSTNDADKRGGKDPTVRAIRTLDETMRLHKAGELSSDDDEDMYEPTEEDMAKVSNEGKKRKAGEHSPANQKGKIPQSAKKAKKTMTFKEEDWKILNEVVADQVILNYVACPKCHLKGNFLSNSYDRKNHAKVKCVNTKCRKQSGGDILMAEMKKVWTEITELVKARANLEKSKGPTENEWRVIDYACANEMLWKFLPCPKCKSTGEIRRHTVTGPRVPRFKCYACGKLSSGKGMQESILSVREKLEVEIRENKDELCKSLKDDTTSDSHSKIKDMYKDLSDEEKLNLLVQLHVQREDDEAEKANLASELATLKAERAEIVELRTKMNELENASKKHEQEMKEKEDLMKEIDMLRANLKNVEALQKRVSELENTDKRNTQAAGTTGKESPNAATTPEVMEIVRPDAPSVSETPNTGQLTYAEIAKSSTPKVNMLPEDIRQKAMDAKKRIEKAMAEKRKARIIAMQNANRTRTEKVTPKLKFLYFSKVERMNAKELKSELRTLLPARAVLSIDFIGRSIMEVLTAAQYEDQTAAILSAIGYKYEKDFDPLMGPKRSVEATDSKEEVEKTQKRVWTESNAC